jgi:predicted transcriptional regulator
MGYRPGLIQPHADQGATIKRVREAQDRSLTDLAADLGIGRRHVKRLQANQRCASGQLARRFGELTGEPLPLPERVHPRMLPPATRAEKRAIRKAPVRYRWVRVGAYWSRERV